MLRRCWDTDNPIHVRYHDVEWGVPLHDDRKLFEFLALGGFQAGLTWWLILQRREAFRQAFEYFELEKVAQFDCARIEKLMHAPQIIHNKAKILAAITMHAECLRSKKNMGLLIGSSGGLLEENPSKTIMAA